MVKKIISGGQTGVDQAALDAAMSCGMEYGGWLPQGRMTEDGPLSEKYNMDVLSTGSYPQRTKKNIEVSDATLLLSRGPLSGGSLLTEKIALSIDRPCLHLNLDHYSRQGALEKINEWLQSHSISILNVAGPRASSDRSLYNDVNQLLVELINDWLRKPAYPNHPHN